MNASDDSMHQFIAMDEARDPMDSDGSETDAVQNYADKAKHVGRARHCWCTKRGNTGYILPEANQAPPKVHQRRYDDTE